MRYAQLRSYTDTYLSSCTLDWIGYNYCMLFFCFVFCFFFCFFFCFLCQPSQRPVQGFFAATVSVFLPLTTVIALKTALMAVMSLDVSIFSDGTYIKLYLQCYNGTSSLLSRNFKKIRYLYLVTRVNLHIETRTHKSYNIPRVPL